jgi:glycosyltransferase involved in cell wall biosynthesis
MKILHVVAGLPPCGGGLSELVPRLAIEAARLGHDVTIATVAQPGEALAAAARQAEAEGVRIARFDPTPPRVVFFSSAMLRELRSLVAIADVVHVHSNWTFPVWWACRCAVLADKPLVMSPHGCFDPVRLAHSAWKKRIAGLFDRCAVRQATAIHATSEAEQAWIERYVPGHRNIVVIPNGVEIPPLDKTAKQMHRTRQVLFLGRLHPLKGLDLLLEAWKLVAPTVPQFDRWKLVIAGPDQQGTRATLEQRTRDLCLPNIEFTGPLFEMEKMRAFAEADLFVLPSRSENFGIAAAEALAASLPLIATNSTPWSAIEGTCGWYVDLGAEPLARALTAAMRLDDVERANLGARGRALIEAKYQWARVVQAMVELYASILDRTTV